MKILFPTDFSNASENAFIYSLKLAERLQATITVVHVYDVFELHTWIEKSTDMQDLNERVTLSEFELFRDRIEGLKRIAVENHLTSIDVNYSLKESDMIVQAILDEARDSSTDLIVIGTRGAAGLKEIFFGSIASKVMEKSPCPVFMVPDTTIYKGILKIGLTLEYKPGELALIEQSLAFVRRLGGHLYCLHVDALDPDVVKTKLQTYKQAFKEETDISFHTHYDLDIEKGILEYMKFNQVDVVVMSVHQQSMLKELFSYSIAKRVAYHTDIPLLALHIEDK